MEKFRHILISFLILLISTLDYWTGPQIEFGVVYLVPVLLAATINRGFGLITALTSASLALLVDITLGRAYAIKFYYLWDFGSRTTIFSLVALLRSNLIQARQLESKLARTDPLTGAKNNLSFYEQAEFEINRAGRYHHPFTIAYIDIDNFKTINDTQGHSVGDELLCTVTATIKRFLRRTDTVARLGGDEFVLLLPETDSESAQAAIPKIQKSLLEKMQQNNWPVTFSIGVLTCIVTPSNPDELVKMADELMYSVKHSTKNAIKYAIYTGSHPSGK